MRGLAGLLSILAIGLVIGGVVSLGALGSSDEAATGSASGLDLRSFLAGLLVGLLCAGMTRVPWLELPRRIVNWVVENERHMYRMALAGTFVLVLLFY